MGSIAGVEATCEQSIGALAGRYPGEDCQARNRRHGVPVQPAGGPGPARLPASRSVALVDGGLKSRIRLIGRLRQVISASERPRE
jgi:hypothetical protein